MHKPKGPGRAAAKRRVSRAREPAPPRAGAQDWKLALIDERHVESLIAARRVGLPLETAAEIAGVKPDLAALWLAEGRTMGELRGRAPSTAYRALCRRLAEQWDQAAAGTVALLRGYMLAHAKKDPKACAQVLTSYEREYAERRRRLRALSAELSAEHAADLAEPFAPLELATGGPVPRSAKLTATQSDGSMITAEVSFAGELDEHTDEEVDFYCVHGYWPHEEARPPIDTTAESADVSQSDEPLPEIEDEIARLQRGAPPPEHALFSEAPAPAPKPVKKVVVVKPAPLRRIDPHADLAEVHQGEESTKVDDRPRAGKPDKAPAFEPLRRIDPQAAR